jgi:hypothetical protein
MKISVKVMMMTLVMVLTVAITYAQPNGKEGQRGGDPTERAKQITERLTTELNLDAKQAKKVEAINLKYAQKQQEMRAEMQKQREAGQKMDREAIGTKIKEMRTAQEEEIKSVLTPTQIEKFEAMPKPEPGEKRKPEGKVKPESGKKDAAMRAKQQTQKMTEALELDDKQIKKVEAINLKYAKQQEELRTELQKENTDKEAIKAKIKTARTAQESELKAVLTPKQIEKFDAIKEERKGKTEKARN